MKDKLIVFDRDGTLIRYKPYLYMTKDVELLEGVKEVLKKLKENGNKLFLHTNQSGVSRGYYSLNDVVRCNNKMINILGLGKNIFEKICIAHDYPPNKNSYRKPSPRFGREIIHKYNVNISSLIYIGDNISDLQTAKNIGCLAYGVDSGVKNLKSKLKKSKIFNFPVYKNMCEFNKNLLDG